MRPWNPPSAAPCLLASHFCAHEHGSAKSELILRCHVRVRRRREGERGDYNSVVCPPTTPTTTKQTQHIGFPPTAVTIVLLVLVHQHCVIVTLALVLLRTPAQGSRKPQERFGTTPPTTPSPCSPGPSYPPAAGAGQGRPPRQPPPRSAPPIHRRCTCGAPGAEQSRAEEPAYFAHSF